MTMIVKHPTKKALREAIAAGEEVFITDPSIFPSDLGPIFKLSKLPMGRLIVVTNHPKRSWFAQITWNTKGELKVS